MSCNDDGPRTASDCTPCSPGIRNRYFRGKLLTVADYEAEQRYAIEHRRRVNRAMLGWGIVSGFPIEPAGTSDIGAGGTVRIGEGFAFDVRGRELVACEPVTLDAPGDVVWLKQGRCGLEPTEPPTDVAASPGGGSESQLYRSEWRPAEDATEDATEARIAEVETLDDVERDKQAKLDEAERDKRASDQRLRAPPLYLLAAHYAERRIDGVIVKEGCGEDLCETNRVCETVVYSLRPLPAGCPPGLASCLDSRWGGGGSAADFKTWPKCGPGVPDVPSPAAPGDRGPHATLVEWSIERSEGKDLCADHPLRRIDGDLAFDPDSGVPLACVAIGFNCGDPYISRIVDPVGPRRLARPNDVLFDLIRGCDLTRIEDVGWKPLLVPNGRVPRDDFFAMFRGKVPASGRVPPVETGFWVLFSGPVQVASLSIHVIAFTLMHWDSNARVQVMHRIPLTGLRCAPTLPGDPSDTTRGFVPIVDGDYWLDEIHMINSSGFDRETLVEIAVRGGLIVAADGQLVAAGGGYLPSRPGWPGSDFISAFTVFPPPAAARRTARRSAR